jgi:hypothetical protein
MIIFKEKFIFSIIFILFFNLNIFAEYHFQKDSSKIITSDITKGIKDNIIWRNNLIWQDEEYSEDEINIYKNNEKNYQKVGTLEYAKEYCKKSTYGGFKNWRLPYFHELNILRDRNNKINHNFKKAPEGFFWSLDEDLDDKTKYKRVAFEINRADIYINKKHHLYIRCIKDKYISDFK